jgi:hypothetical protein
MKHKVTLTITSLLSILFFAFHWADDIVRGRATGGVSGLVGVLILVIWLYGISGYQTNHASGDRVGFRESPMNSAMRFCLAILLILLPSVGQARDYRTVLLAAHPVEATPNPVNSR